MNIKIYCSLHFTIKNVPYLTDEDLPFHAPEINDQAVYRDDRTGTGTWSVFGNRPGSLYTMAFPC